MMWNWLDELAIVRASIPELKPFLFSKEIFWPLTFDRNNPLHSPIIPRLSAGRLILANRILEILSKTDVQIKVAWELESGQLLTFFNNWKANWEKKINLEIPVRLRQWQQFINDLRSSEGVSVQVYTNQIYIRLIIDLLLENSGSSENLPEIQQLAIMDRILRTKTFPSEFIWNNDLRVGFQEDPYWYLYRTTNGSGKN